MATAADIPLLIVSENSSSERRISPSWSIAQLKNRLEPVTGVPATCQRLSLKIGSQTAQPIEAADEESTILAAWPLQAYAEIKVGMIHFSVRDVFHFLGWFCWRYRIGARARTHVALICLCYTESETMPHEHKHAAWNGLEISHLPHRREQYTRHDKTPQLSRPTNIT